MNKDVRLIFDNGGGLTMQLPGYAHHYDDMAQAAEDYKVFLQDGNTNGWEGHEQDAADIDPTYEQQRNGGYEIMDAEDIQTALANPDFDSAWYNVSGFIEELKANVSLRTSNSGIRYIIDIHADRTITQNSSGKVVGTTEGMDAEESNRLDNLIDEFEEAHNDIVNGWEVQNHGGYTIRRKVLATLA